LLANLVLEVDIDRPVTRDEMMNGGGRALQRWQVTDAITACILQPPELRGLGPTLTAFGAAEQQTFVPFAYCPKRSTPP